MTEQDIAKLKAAGFTDADIQDYMANEPGQGQVTAAPKVEEALPEIDVTKPSTTLSQARAQGVPTTSEGSWATDAAAVGAGLAPYAIPAVGATGALIGGGKLYGAWNRSAEAAKALADARMASEQGIAQRAAARAGIPTPSYNVPTANMPAAPSGPVAPTGPAATGPVAPSAAPTAPMAQAAENVAARAPSMLDKTTAMIRQLAANKVVQSLGKGMTGLQLATYSGELGPQTPQVGRMKGMEINPITGRPWTKEQLAQYSANPQMFDSQLPPAQMPR